MTCLIEFKACKEKQDIKNKRRAFLCKKELKWSKICTYKKVRLCFKLYDLKNEFMEIMEGR